MKLRQVITAQNCTIEIAGQEIGYLQNFALNCNYNLTAIKNLHQYEIQHYAQGIATYGATAKRGFVTLDETMFGGETGLLELKGMADEVEEGLQSNSSAYDKFTAIVNAGLLIRKSIDFAKDTIKDIGNVLKGDQKEEPGKGDLFAMFGYFDVVIKNPTTSFPEGLGINAVVNKLIGSKTDLMKLKGCKFDSRSMNFSPANIMVMEDITIVATELTDYVNTIQPKTDYTVN